MKKLNLKVVALLSAILFVGSLLFTSCTKEEVYEPNVSETTPQVKRGKITNNLKWFVIDGTGDYDCDGTGGNCFSDVIVKPSSLFKEVFTVIERGHKPTISRVFKQHYSTLNSYIDAASLVDVINFGQDVEYKYNTSQNKHYLLFKRDREINRVYQLHLR